MRSFLVVLVVLLAVVCVSSSQPKLYNICAVVKCARPNCRPDQYIGKRDPRDCCQTCLDRRPTKLPIKPIKPNKCAMVRCAMPQCGLGQRIGLRSPKDCCPTCLPDRKTATKTLADTPVKRFKIDCRLVRCGRPICRKDQYVGKRFPSDCCPTCLDRPLIKTAPRILSARFPPKIVACRLACRPVVCPKGYVKKQGRCCSTCVRAKPVPTAATRSLSDSTIVKCMNVRCAKIKCGPNQRMIPGTRSSCCPICVNLPRRAAPLADRSNCDRICPQLRCQRGYIPKGRCCPKCVRNPSTVSRIH